MFFFSLSKSLETISNENPLSRTLFLGKASEKKKEKKKNSVKLGKRSRGRGNEVRSRENNISNNSVAATTTTATTATTATTRPRRQWLTLRFLKRAPSNH